MVGIPNPGVELKLVPNGDKLEARLQEPEHHAGLLAPAGADRRRRSTRRAITSSATRCASPTRSDPERGFVFDGRVAEDFKLRPAPGSASARLRLKFIAHCAPYVTDVVVAGQDRDDAAALVVPNVAACRELAGLTARRSDAEVLAHPKVRETFSALLAAFNKGAGGSSGRFPRIILMDDPPSLDSGELTDKGSINQRAVLALRAAHGRGALRRNAVAAHHLIEPRKGAP